MESPMVMEAGEEVLQVLEVCEEKKEVIVTTIEEDSITNSPPVVSPGPGTKTSQVREGKIRKGFRYSVRVAFKLTSVTVGVLFLAVFANIFKISHLLRSY